MTARILVVNDTQEILELFRLFLEDEEGYEVILAGTPIQQIKDVQQIAPDLICPVPDKIDTGTRERYGEYARQTKVLQL